MTLGVPPEPLVKLRLTPRGLCIAALVLLVADWGSQLAGDSVFPGGPLDEAAHLMTTLLALWMLGPRVCERYLFPALVASVAIDADHIPDRLGLDFLTQGTPRPYTHSLLTVLVVLAAAALWRRPRRVLIGVAIGLGLHFFRDLGEPGSGVPLLWPLSRHGFAYPHWIYVVTMAAVVLADAVRLYRHGAASWRPWSRPGPRPSR